LLSSSPASKDQNGTRSGYHGFPEDHLKTRVMVPKY
jgi:hypothetical protein